MATSVSVRDLASAFYRRCSLPTFRAYQRTTAFSKHVVVFHSLDFPWLYATGDSIEFSLGIYFRFSRGVTSLLVVVGRSLPLGTLPFCCWTFLDPCRTSSCDWRRCTSAAATWSCVILAIATVYGPIMSTTGFPLRAPLMFNVSGPVLTLQPICQLLSAYTFLFGCTCPEEPLAAGLRFNFVASGFIPRDQYFLPFSRHRYPYASTTLTPVLVLQPTGLAFLDHFLLYLFGIPPNRV